MLCHDLVSDLRTVRAFRQKGKIFISPPPSISHCNWYCLRETNANTFERRKTRKQIESPGLLPRSERSSKELDLVSTSTSTIIKSFERSTRSILLNERKKKLFEFNFPKKGKFYLPTWSIRIKIGAFFIFISFSKNRNIFEEFVFHAKWYWKLFNLDRMASRNIFETLFKYFKEI